MGPVAKLVDTETGWAAIPELLQEVNEVMGICFPGQVTQIKVGVAMGLDPAQLVITLLPASGVISHAPPGIATVYTAKHMADKQQWQFFKELYARCCCGTLVTQTDNLVILSSHASVHQQTVTAALTGAGPMGPVEMAMLGPHANNFSSTCIQFVEAWKHWQTDIEPEDRVKAMAGMIGAALAGYSDPAQYNLGLGDDFAAAFEEVGKAILEDESLFALTAFVRPVRPVVDAEAALKLPHWARSATGLPFTSWALAQPWYLQYMASRDHPGVQGADTCLPARRAASRVRSEFPEMEAYDALPYEDQLQVLAPQVTEAAVAEKLQLVLHKSGDWRNPDQFLRRLGISMSQLAALVNLREIGNLAIDMCCRCGIFVLDGQPAVACEHCVDVYHLGCQGLKAVPEGDWVCPGCTLASGATGKVAQQAAAMGRSNSKAAGLRGAAGAGGREPGRGRTPASRGPPVLPGRESPAPRSSGAGAAAPSAIPPGGRTSRGPPPPQRATSNASQLMSPNGSGVLPPPVLALPQGVVYKDDDESTEDMMDDDGAISDGPGSGGPPSKRQRTAGGGGGSGGEGKRKAPQRSRYGIFRVDPADAALYATNCPGMPNPNADGRSLVLRIATGLVQRQVSPHSKRWRPQLLVNCNMVAGIHCEYHQDVLHNTPRVVLSEATLVHGGIRCNRCRRPTGASAGGSMEVMAPPPPPLSGSLEVTPAGTPAPDGGLPVPVAVPVPPPGLDDMQVDIPAPNSDPTRTLHVPPPPQPPPALTEFADCNQTFKRLVDFKEHLRHHTSNPACHVWLPKHRLYLQGVPDVFKGLTDLCKEETSRNHNLTEFLQAANQARAEAKKRRMEEGKPEESSDDDTATAMPPPPPRVTSRQKAVQQAASERTRVKLERETSTQPTGPTQTPTTGGNNKGAAGSSRNVKREPSPAYPGFDAESIKKEQARVKALMAVKLSEMKTLAALPRPPVVPAASASAAESQAGEGDKDQDAQSAAAEGAGFTTGGELLQLVQVEGTENYVMVPKAALEASLSAANNTNGTAAADGEAGAPAASATGMPIVPPSMLPVLLSAGGSMVTPAGSGGGSGAKAATASSDAASNARVLSLKLLRRFSALGMQCGTQGEGASVLQSLRTCRDAANSLTDPNIHLEALELISELALRLEEALGGGGAAVQGKVEPLVQDVTDLKTQLDTWVGGQKGSS